jgi:hypothetical protein
MKAWIFALVLLSAALISGCRDKQSSRQSRHTGIEFYRSLQWSETPYDTENGIHRLDPEKIKNVNYYKFTYDEKGLIQSVEFMRNNILLNYSLMGVVAKIVYRYDGSMQTKFFYNSKGEPVEQDGIYAVQYALDSKGNRVQLMYLGRDGSMINNNKGIHYYNWKLLQDGTVKENRFSLEGQEVALDTYCSFLELRFSYNDKGYLTRMANYRNDTLINCRGNSGKYSVGYLAFTTDEAGDVLKTESFTASGQPSELQAGWSKRIFKYDENGNKTECSFYDINNEPLNNGYATVIKYSYDDHGALTEMKFSGRDDQPVTDPVTGAALLKYTYDEEGRRTDTTYFDRNNSEIEFHGALTHNELFK